MAKINYLNWRHLHKHNAEFQYKIGDEILKLKCDIKIFHLLISRCLFKILLFNKENVNIKNKGFRWRKRRKESYFYAR